MTARAAARARLPYALRIAKERNHLPLSGITIAFDVIPYDPEKIHGPRWVLVLVGAVFILGGIALAFRNHELLVSVLGNLIVISFAAVATWAALKGPADQFSGGAPFLPHALNVKIARVLFGGCAVLCAFVLIPGIRRLLKLLSARAGADQRGMPEPRH